MPLGNLDTLLEPVVQPEKSARKSTGSAKESLCPQQGALHS